MKQPFSPARRSLIVASASAVAGIALPGLGRAAQAPIKIALVTSLSGLFTALGFRTTKTSWMLAHPAAQWTYANIAKQGGITLSSDYAAGREYVTDCAESHGKARRSVG